MNRVVGPVIRALLRSPLHGLLSGGLLVVTYEGRRSGRRVAVPVQYRTDGADVVVTVGGPEKKTWWRNFAAGHPATLLLRREEVAVTGRVETGDDGTVRVVFSPR